MTSKNPKTCSIKKTTLLSNSAYCKLCLKALCVHITSVFASSTLKIGGGGLQLLIRGRNTHLLTKKRSFLAIFSMKNGEFWCGRMLQTVFS